MLGLGQYVQISTVLVPSAMLGLGQYVQISTVLGPQLC